MAIPSRALMLGLAFWGATGHLARAQVPLPARDPRAAQPERPTVATHAHTVAPGFLEIETGFQRYRPDAAACRADTPSLAKLGLTPRLQLDVFFGASVLARGQARVWGSGDTSAGVKWRVLDDAPVLGAFALESIVKFPTGSVAKGTGTGTTDLSLLVISSHDFGPVSMDLNAGVTWRNGSGSDAPEKATVWTVSFGVPLAGPVGWGAEVFGYPGTTGPAGSRPAVAMLLGPTLALSKSLVLDGGIIRRIVGDQPWTVYAGLTYNVGRLPGFR
jgi:hypothetical protein